MRLVEEYDCTEDLTSLEPLVMLLYSQTVIPGMNTTFSGIFQAFDTSNIVISLYTML